MSYSLDLAPSHKNIALLHTDCGKMTKTSLRVVDHGFFKNTYTKKPIKISFVHYKYKHDTRGENCDSSLGCTPQ